MPKPLGRSLSSLSGLLLLIAIFLVIVVPLTISQTQLLAANLPAYAGTASLDDAAEAQLARAFPARSSIPANG